jgi:hypothetical protein
MTGIARPGSPPLRVVAAPDPVRIRGGEVPSLDGPVWPFASLPEAAYHMVVKGWSLGPVLHATRPPRAGSIEGEQDWRVFVAGLVTGAGRNQPGAAGSAVQRYLEAHGTPPWMCITFRVAVGVKTGIRRIPKGGRLAQLWELLGHRGAGWSPELADELIGWRLEVLTYTQVEGRRRRPGQTASRLPTALRRTWGLDILEARPPEVGR